LARKGISSEQFVMRSFRPASAELTIADELIEQRSCRTALSDRPASRYCGRYWGKSGHRPVRPKRSLLTHFDISVRRIVAAQKDA